MFINIRVLRLRSTKGGSRIFFLRNDATDGEAKKIKSEYIYTKKKASSQGKGAHPLHPPPRSAPEYGLEIIFKLMHIRSLTINFP